MLDLWQQERAYKRQQFGTGSVGQTRTHSAPVHGTTADGSPVTASFGTDGTQKEGHTYLRDGHADGNEDFWGPDGDKQHDHYDGRGGGTTRGRYTCHGS